MTIGSRVLAPVPLPAGTGDGREIRRADIEVAGLDQAGPSFELRIFLNQRDADAETAPTPDNGYAGSIHVYGYGGTGDEEGAHTPLRPVRSVIATDAVRRAAGEGPAAAVTLVALPYDGPGGEVDLDHVEVAVLIDG